MSGRKFLFDSNIIIYIAKRDLAPETFVLSATALLYDCILVTRNVADFSGLPGLTVLNPFD
jgi:predicted nucleic acid-binding protein